MSRILPRPTPTTQPWFDACRRGELHLQYCGGCRAYQFYPRTLCARCGQRDLEWRKAGGQGRVASYTVVRRGVSDAYPAPYIIALIDLAEGPRLMSVIEEDDLGRVAVGAAVTVDFRAWSDDISMPIFRISDISEEVKP